MRNIKKYEVDLMKGRVLNVKTPERESDSSIEITIMNTEPGLVYPRASFASTDKWRHL